MVILNLKSMKYIIIVVLLISVFSNCKVAESLTLERMDHNGNDLRIDGYYYHPYESGYIAFFLYRNGVYLSSGAILETSSLEQLDQKFLDREVIPMTNIQWFWGVFRVKGGSINIERWLPGTGGPYPTQLLDGELLNDSTILISGLRGKKYEGIIDTFKFRQFSPKPDSTNSFIP